MALRRPFRKDAIVVRNRIAFRPHDTKEGRIIHLESWGSPRVFESDIHPVRGNALDGYRGSSVVGISLHWSRDTLDAFKVFCSNPRPPILMGQLPSNGRLFLDSFNAVLCRLRLLFGNPDLFCGIDAGGCGIPPGLTGRNGQDVSLGGHFPELFPEHYGSYDNSGKGDRRYIETPSRKADAAASNSLGSLSPTSRVESGMLTTLTGIMVGSSVCCAARVWPGGAEAMFCLTMGACGGTDSPIGRESLLESCVSS